MTDSTDSKAARPRGFAALSPEQRSAVSRKGGTAAHANGSAHEFSPAEARKAGSKGGKERARRRREEEQR